MHISWKRAALSVAVPVFALGLAAPTVAATPVNRAAVTDPTGDVEDDNDKVVNAPVTDIVSADAKRVGGDLEVRYTTAKPTDPETDANWKAEDTLAEFLLDTNGDNKEDFTVEYNVDEDGELDAEVYKEPFSS